MNRFNRLSMVLLASACSCGTYAQEVTFEHLCELVKKPTKADQNAIKDKSAEVAGPPFQIHTIEIVTYPIFDESLADTLWLHRFANWLHINTKASALRKELSIKEGEQIHQRRSGRSRTPATREIVFTRCPRHCG